MHGGPGGQSRIGHRGRTQYLVNHGYVAYAINNRGSTGYGKTFFQMAIANSARRISPLFNADRITKPLMVLQGANDPRVILSFGISPSQ